MKNWTHGFLCTYVRHNSIEKGRQDVLLGNDFILLKFMLVITSFFTAKFCVLLVWFSECFVFFLLLFFCSFVCLLSITLEEKNNLSEHIQAIRSFSLQCNVFVFQRNTINFSKPLSWLKKKILQEHCDPYTRSSFHLITMSDLHHYIASHQPSPYLPQTCHNSLKQWEGWITALKSLYWNICPILLP